MVNCANNHPITSLYRGQLYEINEQERDVYKTYYEPYNLLYGREPIRIE